MVALLLTRRWQMLPAGLCVLTLLAGCQTLATDTGTGAQRIVQQHEQLGNAYRKQGRLSDALREWNLALQMDPTNTRCAEQIKALESGMPMNLQAQALDPAETMAEKEKRIEQELLRAHNSYLNSKLKDAEIAWHQVLTMDPESVQAKEGLKQLELEKYQTRPEQEFDALIQEYYEKGMAALRKGDWAQAAVALGNASKLAPKNGQISKYLQQAQEKLADKEKLAIVKQLQAEAEKEEQKQAWLEAQALWKKLLELEPNALAAVAGVTRTQAALHKMAEEWVQGGNKEMQAGRYADAERKYKKALEFNPDSADANSGITAAQKKQNSAEDKKNRREEARKVFEQGVVYYQAGNGDLALREWEKAVQMDPAQAEYSLWLKRAQDEAEKKQSKNVQVAKSRYQEGLQAFQREDLEAATKAFKDVVELAPREPEAEKALKHIAKIKELQK